jgi:hypothetical protein
MKRLVGLLAILGLFLTACFDTFIYQKSLSEFSERFVKANSDEDMDAMLELYDTGGLQERDLAILKTALSFEIGLPILSISFEGLSGAPEESITYEHDDISYEASLTPKLRMLVEYDIEGRLSSKFSIGRNFEKEWKIITAIPQNKK